jgi:hypothetical protein
LRLVDLLHVGAQMVDGVLQPRRDLRGVMSWIVVVAFHAVLLSAAD